MYREKIYVKRGAEIADRGEKPGATGRDCS